MSHQEDTLQFDDNSTSKPSYQRSTFSPFQAEVRELWIKENDRCRILPAFGPRNANDAGFKTSVSPYRAGAPEKGIVPFTSWFRFLRIYHMVGADKSSWLSQSMLSEMARNNNQLAAAIMQNPKMAYDPVRVLRDHMLALKGKEWLKTAVYGTGKNTNDVYPRDKSRVVYNGARVDDRRPVIADPKKSVGLVMQSESAHNLMTKALDYRLGRHQNPINTAQFGDQYALGDITHPQFGLLAIVRSLEMGIANSTAKTNTFVFVDDVAAFNPEDAVTVPVGNDVLEQRRPLGSSSTLRIEPPQRIVDYILAGGMPDVDIAEARKAFSKAGFSVGDGGSIGVHTEQTRQAPEQQEQHDAGDDLPGLPPQQEAAEPARAAPPPPLAPTPVTPVTPSLTPEKKFWVCVDGVVEDEMKNAAHIISLLAAGKSVQILVDGTAQWDAPEVHGIRYNPKPTPPPAPAKPAAPAKPTPPPPPAPAKPAAPAAAPRPAEPATKPAHATQAAAAPTGIPDDWGYYDILADMKTKLTSEEIQELYDLSLKTDAGNATPDEQKRIEVLFEKAQS